MRCDLCGSKKNVRSFPSVLGRSDYKECRECFEKAFVYGCKMGNVSYTKEDIEKEWNRGKDK